jgi:hypothetical protein
MVVQFTSYSNQSPLPQVVVWNESFTSSTATTVAQLDANAYTATFNATSLATGYYWVVVAISGGGEQTFAIRIADNVRPTHIGETPDHLRQLVATDAAIAAGGGGGGGGGTNIINVLPFSGSTPDRSRGTSITTFFMENAAISMSLDDADLDDMTLEFSVENADRSDVLLISNAGISRTGSTFTVTITTAVTGIIGNYSWSLRDATNDEVLGYGLLTVRYAAFSDA